MTKVNKKFIEEMQGRLDDKDKIYVGELNYKNMTPETLWFRLMESTKLPQITLSKELLIKKVFKEETMKELVDIANFCWMLWERLGDDNEK